MRRKIAFILFIGFLVFSGTGLFAQEKLAKDSTWNDWNFRVSPYFWYIGLKGTIYKPPTPIQYPIPPPPKYEIDVGFKDIKNSIKFALMLAGQYRNKYIVTQFNLSTLVLESEAITPFELLLQDNIVNLTYAGGDVALGYRVIRNPKFEFDALLGLKFVYFKIGLSTNLAGIVAIEGERDRIWVDPVIVFNLKYRPHRKIEFLSTVDFGPAVIDNLNTNQAMVFANYLFTKTFHISLGYRYYHVDFPKNEAIFNGSISGWIMKIGFQF